MTYNDKQLSKDLFDASLNGHAREVLSLLMTGTDPDGYKDSIDHTALHWACTQADPLTTQYLVQWGAHLEAINKYKLTPLHVACARNSQACVEVLMRRHCSGDIKDKYGDTPADLARRNGHSKLAEFVCNYQFVPRDPLSTYPSIKQLSQLKVSNWRKIGQTTGVSEDQLDTAEGDPLPIAVVFLAAKVKKPELNWKDVVESLLTVGEHGTAASLCHQEASDGHTPMSVSAYYGWADFRKYLEKEGKHPKTAFQQSTPSLEAVHEPPPQSAPILPRNWIAVTDRESDKVAYMKKAGNTQDKFFTPPGYPLNQTSAHPGVTFFDYPQIKQFTHSCDHFDFDNGVEVTVPPDAIKAGSSVNIKVQPSLAPKDVFVMPEGVQSASPSYLLSSEGGNIGGEVTVTMEHHIKVATKEEADNLLFLRADSAPKKSGSKFVYEFKEVLGAKSQFIPGENKGRLMTTHFSFLKIGVRLKKWFTGLTQTHEERPPDRTLYTVRVYRSPPQTTSDRMAIICVSLFGRLYAKFLEELDKEMIPHDYPEVSICKADRTIIGSLQFTEMFARLNIQPLQGWTVEPDKEVVSKAEVDQPETENYKPEDLHDYPPKIVCRFYPEKNSPERATAKLCLSGMQPNVTVSMPLRAAVVKPQVTVDTSKLQEAAIMLKKTALQVSDSHLGSTVDSILLLIDKMTSALMSSSLGNLAVHTDSIKREIKNVVEVSRNIAAECTRQTIKDNIGVSVSMMEVLCHQLCQCTKVKLKHCQDESEEMAALIDLVESGANLLTTVNRLLRDMKTLSGFNCGSTGKVPVTLTVDKGVQGLICDAVVKATSDARSRWYDLGIELGIDLETLKTIGKQHQNISDDCHVEMMMCWLSLTKPSPSWSALVRALQCNVMSRGDIARRIQKDHQSDKQETNGEKDFTLKEVRRVTWDARVQWRNLGSELNIDSDTLAAIEESYSGKVDRCHTEMLVHWFQSTSPKSSSLIDALSSQSVGPRGDIASVVREIWGTETSYMCLVDKKLKD